MLQNVFWNHLDFLKCDFSVAYEFVEGTAPRVTGVIELFSPLLPGGSIGGTIQTIIVNVSEPLAFT